MILESRTEQSIEQYCDCEFGLEGKHNKMYVVLNLNTTHMAFISSSEFATILALM